MQDNIIEANVPTCTQYFHCIINQSTFFVYAQYTALDSMVAILIHYTPDCILHADVMH